MAAAKRPRKKKAAPRAADELLQPGAAADKLRREAEERFDGLSAAAAAAAAASPAPEDVTAIVHELRVHQIELEMQNDELRGVQLELDAQREKYFELFDQAPVGYLTLSDNGIVGDANFTAVHLLGVERQLLVGQPFSACVLAADRDAYYLHQRTLQKTKAPQTCELRLQRVGAGAGGGGDGAAGGGEADADAAHFWAHLESRPQRGADGESLSVWVTFTDVAERKAAEEALRASERHYRDLLDTLQEGIWAIDAEGLTTFVNPCMAEMLGHTAEEMLGRHLFDFMDAAERELATVSLERRRQGISEQHDFVFQRKDGTPLITALETTPLYDENGDYAGGIAGIQDITERVQTGNALADSEQRFRAIAEQSRDLIALTDRDGVIVYASPASQALFGVGPEEMAGRHFAHFLDESAVTAASSTFRDAVRNDRTCVDLELRMKRRDGSTFIGELTGSPFRARSQSGTLVTIRDITERKQAEDALAGSARELRQQLQDAVKTMGAIIGLRDPYTAAHERRVTGLATAIAVEMGLSDEAVEGLAFAGEVHDIGKIGIPAEILSKPAALSEIELALIKQHPQAGRELLGDIRFRQPVAEIVAQHHERQDGSSYPAGLQGDEIMLEARILAVADVVEAMASNRPYRPALGLEAALEEVRAGAGTRYDDDAVAACELVFAQGFVFPEP